MSIMVSKDFNTEALKSEDLKTEISNTKGPLLVDFYANWCGPCKMMSPVVSNIEKEYGDSLKVIKVDIDKHFELASKYQISSIPSMLLFLDGKLIDTHVGFTPEEKLKDIIDSTFKIEES